MRELLDQLTEHLGDRYRIEGELGRGGTAVVYRARDVRLGRIVAIKVFDPELLGAFGVERFVREIALEAQLNHPHIVPLLDTGEVAGTPYFIMPCIEGETLRARLDRERELPVDDAVQIARDVAVALMHAHERGIVHRDIKPENILLTSGTAVVADFGIARLLSEVGAEQRLTRTGLTLGTIPYMSPEQALAEPSIDARSDIYSLGCTLFEMLAGEAPHTGPSAQSIIAKRLSEPPRSARLMRTSVSPALDRVVKQALAVNPADRFASAEEFIQALARARTGEFDHAALEPTPSTDLTLGPAPALVRPAVPRRRRLMFGLALSALVVLTVVAAGVVWRARGPARVAGTASTLAVLPFTDLSEHRDQEFFALGMAEELIRAMSRLPGVRVTGRTSSFALRDTRDDPQAIGRRLNVAKLLTGSVRRAGDSLRISAELVNTTDGQPVWTGSYDRAVRDVFAVQEEIARAIAVELSIELGPRQALVAPTTRDVGAYQLYLRGQLAWAQRTPQSLAQAVEFYRQAVTLDPTFARAWASMADTYTAIARNLFGRPDQYMSLARDAAQRAVSLDSGSTEAHTALAAIAYYADHDWARADSEFRRAIALDSTYSEAHYLYALFLSTVQRADSAAAHARRALALEPLSGPANMGPGLVLYMVNQPAAAVPLLRAAVAANPRFYFTYIWLAVSLAGTGDSSAAVKAADEAVRLAPTNNLMLVMRGQVFAVVGRREAALGVAREMTELARHVPIPNFELGRLYAMLGERELALDWIDRSIKSGETQASQLLTPGFKSLRDEPRFAAYLKLMHLSPAPR